MYTNQNNAQSIIETHIIDSNDEKEIFSENIQLIYVLAGRVVVNCQNMCYELFSEDILLINSCEKYKLTYVEDNLAIRFTISLWQLQDILKQDVILFFCNTTLQVEKDFSALKQTMHNILNYHAQERKFGELYINEQYYALLYRLCTEYLLIEQVGTSYKKNKNEEHRMQLILSYIHSNYQKNISLQELADLLYMSNTYLSKYIKKKLGMSFLDYLNRVRLGHALQDLLSKDISITKIAMDNGFANVSAFTRRFKDIYHELPSVYKRNKKTVPLSDDEESARKLEQIKHYLNTKPSLQARISDIPEIRHSSIDVSQRHNLTKTWKVINIGPASTLLRVDIQDHVRYLKKTLDFKYIRFWDIFSKDMYLNPNAAPKDYNFTRLDKVLDFLIEMKLTPYIELGAKPKVILNSLKASPIEYENTERFDSKRNVEQFIDTLMPHLINRYGEEEVRNWYLEFWKDEHVGNLVVDDDYYYKTFRVLSSSVKKYIPDIKIGGAGFSPQFGREEFSRILKRWVADKHPPDFISIYIFPFVPTGKPGLYYAVHTTDDDFFINMIREVKKIMTQTAGPHLPLHVTEWNLTPSNTNIVNDSCNKGAFILKNLIDTAGLDLIQLSGYWIATDAISDYVNTSKILTGAGGLITKDGIAKPAYYAFDFMNQAGNELIHKEQNLLVTAHGYNSYSIIGHNFTPFNNKYYLTDDQHLDVETIDELFVSVPNYQVNIVLSGLKPGKYQIKTYSINRNWGSIQDEWRRMGLITNINKPEIDYLRKICVPKLSIETLSTNEDKLNIFVNMCPCEIRHVYIKKLV